jgi:predicted permease
MPIAHWQKKPNESLIFIKRDSRLSSNEQKIKNSGKNLKVIFYGLVFYLFAGSVLALFVFFNPDTVKLSAILFLIISVINIFQILSCLYSISRDLETIEPEIVNHQILGEGKN